MRSAELEKLVPAAGPERDAFLREFVRAHFPNDPEAALIWSTAITDAGKRDRRLIELLPQWHQRDPAAAEAWIGDLEHRMLEKL